MKRIVTENSWREIAHQFESLIRQVVREEVAAAQAKEAYSEKEFCALVGISRPTARRMRERGELQFKQIGRRVVYTREHITGFLKSDET